MNGSKARAARKAGGSETLKDRLAKAVQRNRRAAFTKAKAEYMAKEKAEIKEELAQKRHEQQHGENCQCGAPELVK